MKIKEYYELYGPGGYQGQNTDEPAQAKPTTSAPHEHPNQNNPYRDQGCYQRGCMAPGSMSQSTHGQGPWWCQQHFNKDDDNPALRPQETVLLKHNLLLYQNLTPIENREIECPHTYLAGPYIDVFKSFGINTDQEPIDIINDVTLTLQGRGGL